MLFSGCIRYKRCGAFWLIIISLSSIINWASGDTYQIYSQIRPCVLIFVNAKGVSPAVTCQLGGLDEKRGNASIASEDVATRLEQEEL